MKWIGRLSNIFTNHYCDTCQHYRGMEWDNICANNRCVMCGEYRVK